MTTDQTIDGVPRLRELLERVADPYRREPRSIHLHNSDIAELRALLDAPVECRCKRYGKDNPHWPCPVHAAPAAQYQGEPVAYRCRHSATEPWFFSDKPGYWEWQALYAEQPAPLQARVKPWLLECFGEAIAADRQERNHRFLEEALELVQANQCTASEAHQLVDYVYGRPVGEPSQEVGGVMVTLAALCLATEIDMHAAGETELGRIWTKVDQIRAKQAAKPAMSPLPGVYPDREQPAPVAVVPDGYCIMPRQLTAENGAKALLLGEFKLLVTKECPECCELEEPVEGCSICDGEGEYGQKHTIPWDQIKFIYSKAVSGLAVKAESAKSR